MENSVLIVDDDKAILDSLDFALSGKGIDNIVLCQDSREAPSLLSKQAFDVVLLDITMPHINGEELLEQIVQDYPGMPVIMFTADSDIATVVRCMKLQAFDYVTKPIEIGRLAASVKKAIELRNLQKENLLLRQNVFTDKLRNPGAFKKIVTRNSVLRSIFQYIETISPNDRPVLITGETGVGKEEIPIIIHELSGRKGELVAVNVAGLDDIMFSDTLFGHEKGAFTGADRDRGGLIERASGGTLFLDEIGDLSEVSQVKLLRLLQNREYYPLGSDIQKLTDTRVVVATHHDIRMHVERGKFRKDLFYRLSAHHIEIPPLRDRSDDIPLLVEHFLEDAAESLGKKKPTPPDELFVLLSNYHFPGNIRELQGIIIDAVSRHEKGKLSLSSFKKAIAKERNKSVNSNSKTNSDAFQNEKDCAILIGERFPTIREIEQKLIQEAMERANNNQSIAAQMLGISRSTLISRLKK